MRGWICLIALLAGCRGQPEPVSEERLAQALEAMQQGRLDEARRHLEAIKTSGGWLQADTWSAPLALRLRAQISLKRGAQDETVRLFKEYEHRYGHLAPAAYARDRLSFLKRFKDWQGTPALLYLRGLEAEKEMPALALREWRTLLRDYSHSGIAPAAQLKLGLLQQRLGNAAWALAELSPVSQLPLEAVDPAGNPVAPQALLAMGQIRRDLMNDKRAARSVFLEVRQQYGQVVMHGPGEALTYSPAVLAQLELAQMAKDHGALIYAQLAEATAPTGFATAEMIGDIRAHARLRLAEINFKRRNWARARQRLVAIARLTPDVLTGPVAGPRRWYGYVAADWLEAKLGAHSTKEALLGLAEMTDEARKRELWAYAQLKRVRLLTRLGRAEEAWDILADMELRFPNVTCDPEGDGLLLVPAREARRVLGG